MYNMSCFITSQQIWQKSKVQYSTDNSQTDNGRFGKLHGRQGFKVDAHNKQQVHNAIEVAA